MILIERKRERDNESDTGGKSVPGAGLEPMTALTLAQCSTACANRTAGNYNPRTLHSSPP